jgi:alpha-1,2-mannosyltransferase
VRSGALRAPLLVLVIGVAAVYVGLGASRQWDFETYYYAASAWRAGRNPYLLDSLTAMAGKPIGLGFIYPPIALLLFLPFTFLPAATAALLWIGFKIFLVMMLLRLWRRDFLPSIPLELLIPVALLGFDLALLWDLRTGNAALIEEVFLWAAFSAYVRDRRRAFVCLVGVASTLKLYPIVFLGLALVPPASRRGGLRLVGLGLLVFLGLLAVPHPLTAEWVKALAAPVYTGRPVGGINPSALGLIDWGLLAAGAPGGSSGRLGLAIYAIGCAVLISLSRRGLVRAWRSGSPREAVLAAVLIWMVVAPRLIVYSYVMAVVPVLAVIGPVLRTTWARAAALGLVFLPGVVRLIPGTAPSALPIVSYAALLWMWLAYARSRRPAGTPLLSR